MTHCTKKLIYLLIHHVHVLIALKVATSISKYPNLLPQMILMSLPQTQFTGSKYWLSILKILPHIGFRNGYKEIIMVSNKAPRGAGGRFKGKFQKKGTEERIRKLKERNKNGKNVKRLEHDAQLDVFENMGLAIVDIKYLAQVSYISAYCI